MFKINDSLIAANLVNLSKKEQDDLIAIIRGKDKRQTRFAKEILLSRCRPMVEFVASMYKSSNIDFKKLVRCGEAALLKAAETYNVNKRYRFVVYASWFVRTDIHKLLGLPADPERFKFEIKKN